MHGIDVANKVAHFELENAAALADLIKSEGIDFLRSSTSYHGPEDVEKTSGVKGAVALYTFPAAAIQNGDASSCGCCRSWRQPPNSHAAVRAVSAEADSKGYWTLETNWGTDRARRIVFATNEYTSGLLPEYTDTILPARRE
ncbi:hypothetical protein F4823DRAFT_566017 [Ustulina deusta]|nr:hypothetical protein F4823DRAFT_566017 [Ustulina deusta]